MKRKEEEEEVIYYKNEKIIIIIGLKESLKYPKVTLFAVCYCYMQQMQLAYKLLV